MTTALVYRVRRIASDGGYLHDKITIAECDVIDVADRLAGTVDNRDGYGSGDAAYRMGRLFAAMLKDGHKLHYETRRSFTVEFQVYRRPYESDNASDRTMYCRPHFEWPDSFEKCAWAHALALKIGKRIERVRGKRYDRPPGDVVDNTFDDPEELIAAIAHMGAVRVADWRDPTGSYQFGHWVEDRADLKFPPDVSAHVH